MGFPHTETRYFRHQILPVRPFFSSPSRCWMCDFSDWPPLMQSSLASPWLSALSRISGPGSGFSLRALSGLAMIKQPLLPKRRKMTGQVVFFIHKEERNHSSFFWWLRESKTAHPGHSERDSQHPTSRFLNNESSISQFEEFRDVECLEQMSIRRKTPGEDRVPREAAAVRRDPRPGKDWN